MLANRIALVTGAASGIGESIAKTFAQYGAQVAVCDLNQKSCNQVMKNLVNSKHHMAIEIDVTQKDSISNAVEKMTKSFGKPPDIVVNSAGIINRAPGKNMIPIPLLKMEEKIFDEVIKVNLGGTFLVNQITANAMKEFKINGSIVNISSIAGKTGYPGHCNYNASKAGIIGFTKSAAKELGKFGIRVNCICPGFIQSAGMSSDVSQKAREAIEVRIPLGEFGYPEDIAETAAFLVSEKSKYITGAILDVNGGIY